MSILNNSLLLKKAADSTPDPVTRSLRFDRASTQKLTRTFGTPTSQKKVTISWWMKLAEQGNGSTGYGGIITVGDDSSNYAAIKVMGGATNSITVDEVSSGAYKSDRQTSRAFRDMGAWMHCVHVIDTTDSTADDRSKLYINGVRYTGPFATSYATYAQDYDTNWSKSGEEIAIGLDNSTSGPYFGGYLANIHYIDGQALDASDFAETNPSTGQWVPKEYSGTYGNQGFHLDFKEDGATTSSNSGIGKDVSGNGNYFATTNLSSAIPDTPTKNYATMSPVSRTINSGSVTFGEGNLSVNSSGTYNKTASTIAMPSGKWYAEIRPASQNNAMVGVCRATDIVTSSTAVGYGGSGHVVYVYNGSVYNGSTTRTSYAFSSADGDDVIQLAVDVDNLKIWFGLNNTWEGTVGSSGGHSLDAGEQVFAYTYRDEVIWNFGQDPTFAGNKTSGQDTSQSEFYYAPPNDSDGNPFKSLNTSNLAAPIVTPSEHFDILTYTGNSDPYNSIGSTQDVTGVNFDVGMAWIKDRDNKANSSYTNSGSYEYGNYLFDTITGTSSGGYNLDYDVQGDGSYLNSYYYGVTSFSAGSGTSRGITVDGAGETNFHYDDGYGDIRTERYVAWLWKLGSTGSSSTWNSSYTAPNTEHYNDLAGVTTLDVTPVSSGELEVAHSLSAAPEFFFVTDDSGYGEFSAYPAFHKDLSSGNYLKLDASSAQISDSTYFPSGAAHADYIKLGTIFRDTYGGGHNTRIWAFTGVEGYSKFGKYTGNGNTTGAGPAVYLGFKPALLMIKRIDSSNNWVILDGKRNPSNTVNLTLQADSFSAEAGSSDTYLDFISSGFKIRNTSTANWLNATSGTYIYAAFAESPFKHANAR